MLNNAEGDKEDFLLLVVALSPSAKNPKGFHARNDVRSMQKAKRSISLK
jgi:hypothetical protein